MILSFLRITCICRFASTRSKIKNIYPPLNDCDIKESLIKGTGPGGSKVNTSVNCVQLQHIPSGIIIKCHQDRSLDVNRKTARYILQEKLDIHYNGENSLVAQKRRAELEKEFKYKARAQKDFARPLSLGLTVISKQARKSNLSVWACDNHLFRQTNFMAINNFHGHGSNFDATLGNFQPDSYNCITVDTRNFPFPHLSNDDIGALLDRSLNDWQGYKGISSKASESSAKIKAVWFKVGISDSRWIPLLVQRGFEFHHAIGRRHNHNFNGQAKPARESITHNIPSYAFTTVGVAGMVLHPEDEAKISTHSTSQTNECKLALLDDARILMICEARGNNWKYPGGLAEPGEELGFTACREVREETGFDATFEGLLTFRHMHNYLFGCSDLYFVCVLKATHGTNPKQLIPNPGEIREASWMPIRNVLGTDQGLVEGCGFTDSVKHLTHLFRNYLKTINALPNTELPNSPALPALMLTKNIPSYDRKTLQTWYST